MDNLQWETNVKMIRQKFIDKLSVMIWRVHSYRAQSHCTLHYAHAWCIVTVSRSAQCTIIGRRIAPFPSHLRSDKQPITKISCLHSTLPNVSFHSRPDKRNSEVDQQSTRSSESTKQWFMVSEDKLTTYHLPHKLHSGCTQFRKLANAFSNNLAKNRTRSNPSTRTEPCSWDHQYRPRSNPKRSREQACKSLAWILWSMLDDAECCLDLQKHKGFGLFLKCK